MIVSAVVAVTALAYLGFEGGIFVVAHVADMVSKSNTVLHIASPPNAAKEKDAEHNRGKDKEQQQERRKESNGTYEYTTCDGFDD